MTENRRDLPKRLVRNLLLALLFAGVLLRIAGIASPLDYDEIWTLTHFAPMPAMQIFQDLALPNNQPLNTLGVKWMASLTDTAYLIRVPALLAGLGSLLLFPFIAFYLCRSRRGAIAATAIFAVSQPAVAYAQQARGYSIQLFFLLLFAAGLIADRHFRPKRFPRLPEAAVLLGGAGAVLTLPTSILYLAPMGLWWLCVRRHELRKHRPMLVALGAGAVLTLLWYLLNYQAFRAGQVWGIPITSAEGFFRFVGETVWKLETPLVLFFFAVGFLTSFRRARWFALLIAIPLLAALATNGGGARTYLPLVACFAIPAGMGVEALCRRFGSRGIAAPILLLAVTAGFVAENRLRPDVWAPRDWIALFERVRQLPLEALAVLPASDGYPYGWNNGDNALSDQSLRLDNRAVDRALASIGGNGEVSGIDGRGSQVAFAFAPGTATPEIVDYAGEPVYCRRIRLTEAPPPEGGDFVAIIGPAPLTLFRKLQETLGEAYPAALRLNPWLQPQARLPNGEVLTAGMWIFHLEPGRKEFLPGSPRNVRFYRILP